MSLILNPDTGGGSSSSYLSQRQANALYLSLSGGNVLGSVNLAGGEQVSGNEVVNGSSHNRGDTLLDGDLTMSNANSTATLSQVVCTGLTTGAISRSRLIASSATNAIDTSRGAIHTLGGVGIGQDLRVGGLIYGSLASPSGWLTKASANGSMTLQSNYAYVLSINNANQTLVLPPNPANNDIITLTDGTGTLGTYPILISYGGSWPIRVFDQDIQSFTMSTPYMKVELTFCAGSTKWNITGVTQAMGQQYYQSQPIFSGAGTVLVTNPVGQLYTRLLIEDEIWYDTLFSTNLATRSSQWSLTTGSFQSGGIYGGYRKVLNIGMVINSDLIFSCGTIPRGIYRLKFCAELYTDRGIIQCYIRFAGGSWQPCRSGINGYSSNLSYIDDVSIYWMNPASQQVDIRWICQSKDTASTRYIISVYKYVQVHRIAA
jgi:hypothetical protein